MNKTIGDRVTLKTFPNSVKNLNKFLPMQSNFLNARFRASPSDESENRGKLLIKLSRGNIL